MPAVLSMTLAIGSMALARMKAIVTRLESIEEMAGIGVLCSDETGTLTEIRPTLGIVWVLDTRPAEEAILAGALASKSGDRGAIDTAVNAGLEDAPSLARYRQVRFTPIDPVHKRTEATTALPGSSSKTSPSCTSIATSLSLRSTSRCPGAHQASEASAWRQGERGIGLGEHWAT
jgi:H+-transporting ATPase